MKTLTLLLILRSLALLPLGLVRNLGALIGKVSWLTSSRMAETTRINLALCFSELDESKRMLLAKASIINTFQTITECGSAWLWPAEKIMEHILEVEGLELLQRSQAAGKGTVLLAPHLGNWEVFGLFLNTCGCGQSSQLYQAPKSKALDRIIYSARGRVGAKMVATDTRGVALLLKALKSGEIVGILPDQVPPKTGGDFAPFFGKQVLTMSLVSRLLQKTGARAVVGCAMRVRLGNKAGWKIIFREPDEKIYAEHIQESLIGLNTSVENVVKEFPEQYQWEYKRFKRLPPGEKRPY